MRFGTLIVVCGLLSSHWATTARCDQAGTGAGQPIQARIAELIEQLGAKSYSARRRAARDLAAIGVPAKAALLAARQNPDPEVRFRAGEVLETVLELDFHLRLEAFMADVNGRGDHDLAGWPRFRELVGENGPARRLFAAMQQSERHLLALADQNPAEAGELLEERCDELQSAQAESDDEPRPQPPSLGSIAAVLFVASDRELPVSSHAGTCVYGLSVQDEVFKAATSGEKAQAVKRLLGAWVRRSDSIDWTTANQSCFLAAHYRLNEGADLAIALLHGDGVPQQVRQVAIQTLARLAGKRAMPELAPLLDDPSECGAERPGPDNEETVKTQICDVALAAMVYLTGQELGDYGFKEAQSNPIMLFDARTLGFADPAAREAALRKWKDWAAANPERLKADKDF
jgi:HEAT repeat protein